MPYELRCETCAFEGDAPTVDEALRLETEHKARYGDDHRVTIERTELQ